MRRFSCAVTVAALTILPTTTAVAHTRRHNNSLQAWCATHADTLPYANLIRQTLPPIMTRVSCCESHGKPGAGRQHSSKGLLQVHWGANGPALRHAGIAHTAADLYRPAVNVRAARLVLDTQGLRAWNPSRHCWGV